MPPCREPPHSNALSLKGGGGADDDEEEEEEEEDLFVLNDTVGTRPAPLGEEGSLVFNDTIEGPRTRERLTPRLPADSGVDSTFHALRYRTPRMELWGLVMELWSFVPVCFCRTCGATSTNTWVRGWSFVMELWSFVPNTRSLSGKANHVSSCYRALPLPVPLSPSLSLSLSRAHALPFSLSNADTILSKYCLLRFLAVGCRRRNM